MTIRGSSSKKLKIRTPSSNTTIHANVDRKSSEKHAELPASNSCNKRKLEVVLDGQKQKRRRMDPLMKHRCGALLNSLIAHPNGRIFCSPVDPVALNIPDYFSIISNPMDLGTIKSKLANNKYFTSEEFASDIKLTFSNAMLYNPPDHPVHCLAKDLEFMFIRRWKLLEKKWEFDTASGSEKTAQDTTKTCYSKSKGLVSSGTEKSAQDSRKSCCKTSQGSISSRTQKISHCEKPNFGYGVVAKKPMSSREKQKLKKDLIEAFKVKMNGKLKTLLQKFGFLNIIKEKIDVHVDSLDDDILWELERVLKHPPNAISAKDSKCKTLSSQIKVQDCDSKILSTHTSILDLDTGCLSTKGSGSSVDEAKTHPCSSSLSRTVATANSCEGCSNSLLDKEQCNEKALRAAMLTSRYAELIAKANGTKPDVQQQRERLKRLQREQQALEARKKEEQSKKEAELKRQREKQREAARLALTMMERTVEFDDNIMILKELETLSQCSASYVLHENGPKMVFKDLKTGKVLKPLEQLGLRLKEEVMDDVDEATSSSWEGEEGRS